MPVRPQVGVPCGVHADTQALHDRKPITRAHIEAAIQRRLAVSVKRRVDTWRKLNNPTDGTHSRRRKRAAVFDQQVSIGWSVGRSVTHSLNPPGGWMCEAQWFGASE